MSALTQEDINILAAEFNLTPEGNEPEIFAKALSLCQKFKRELETERRRAAAYREVAIELEYRSCGVDSFNPEHDCHKFSEQKVDDRAKKIFEERGE